MSDTPAGDTQQDNAERVAVARVREDIAFRGDDGGMLRGWVITPDTGGPHPVIVMTPGFSSSITRLENIANAFVARGFGVLLYDQRTCGRSDGQPRQDIDPVAQDRDMQMALTFAQQHPALDGDRIGLWGSSFSEGNVLVVAAMDRRVKAVVSQVPFISGYEQFVLGNGIEVLNGVYALTDKDRLAQLGGAEPGRLQLVRMPDDPPEQFVLFEDENDYEYLVGGPDGPAEGWVNSVTIHSTGRALAYDVRPFMPRISPTPLMMIVAGDDQTTPPSLALDAFETAREPKELLTITGGHFGVYWPHLSPDLVTAARWFETHLGVNNAKSGLTPETATSTSTSPGACSGRSITSSR